MCLSCCMCHFHLNPHYHPHSGTMKVESHSCVMGRKTGWKISQNSQSSVFIITDASHTLGRWAYSNHEWAGGRKSTLGLKSPDWVWV